MMEPEEAERPEVERWYLLAEPEPTSIADVLWPNCCFKKRRSAERFQQEWSRERVGAKKLRHLRSLGCWVGKWTGRKFIKIKLVPNPFYIESSRPPVAC
jgi:hypothetical protein